MHTLESHALQQEPVLEDSIEKFWGPCENPEIGFGNIPVLWPFPEHPCETTEIGFGNISVLWPVPELDEAVTCLDPHDNGVEEKEFKVVVLSITRWAVFYATSRLVAIFSSSSLALKANIWNCTSSKLYWSIQTLSKVEICLNSYQRPANMYITKSCSKTESPAAVSFPARSFIFKDNHQPRVHIFLVV